MDEPKMPPPAAKKTPAQLEKVRDLRKEVGSLQGEDLPEVVFSMRFWDREPRTIFNSATGEPTTIPEYMVPRALDLVNEDGTYRFVADAANAPEFKLGDVLCFMHPASPDREIGIAAGLEGKTCPKATLASEYSRTLHAQHRHKSEWAAFQNHLSARSAAEERDERRQQLDATLAIARAAQGAAEDKAPQAAEPEAVHNCQDCDWQTKPSTKNPEAALAGHVRAKHPVGVA